jgi:hypothetical protein
MDASDLVRYRSDVAEVGRKRDLATATEYGATLNRFVSEFDRRSGELTAAEGALLEIVHAHVRVMMDCPRRMRLDTTWPDDFVNEARAAADVLITLVNAGE